MDRRVFIKKSGFGIGGVVAGTSALQAGSESLLNNQNTTTVLFQGDSITDAGRDRGRYYPNDGSGMGGGYVSQIVASVLGQHPQQNFRFYNRGISGNKVYQLAERWEDDCLQLKPDVLSILIGVNDFWHTFTGYQGSVEKYTSDFTELLSRTIEKLPNVKLVIGEPFAVNGGTAINDRWLSEFPEYQKTAHDIAREFNAVFIPFQAVFNEAIQKAPASYWCPDGVHPTMAGSYLMKEAWLKAAGHLLKL